MTQATFTPADFVRKVTDLHSLSPGILITGHSGAGKTHAACEGGRPLVLLLERNGLSTVEKVNSDADVIIIEESYVRDEAGKVVTERGRPKVALTPMNLLRQVVTSIRSGQLPTDGYDRIVIDSLTEVQRLIKDEIWDRKRAIARENNEVADDVDFSIRDWGTLADRMTSFLRMIRAIPIPVIGITLLDETEGENTPAARVRPQLEGRKAPNQIAQFFTAIGVLYKQQHEDKTLATAGVYDHWIHFDLPQPKFLTKSHGPCRGKLRPNIVAWIQELSPASVASTNTSPAEPTAEPITEPASETPSE